MKKRVLLTGATGLIGKSLTNHLRHNGFIIYQLERNPQNAGNAYIRRFKWNVNKGEIDPECINGVSAIIHLAGEPIAAKRWTKKRKLEIVESRTRSINMIYDLLRKNPNQVDTVISASAVGFYGDRNNEFLTESSHPGRGFLADVCMEWEKAVDEGTSLNLRIVKLRTGIVLSNKGGALIQLARPLKFGIGTIFGSGKQWMPWIHLEDVVNLYTFAIQNEQIRGIYNMAAANPVTNQDFTETIARILNKKAWLPRIPELALKLALGEMSAVLLDSTRTLSDKIRSEGFTFRFNTLEEALRDLYPDHN